jgi:hypothetical protein
MDENTDQNVKKEVLAETWISNAVYYVLILLVLVCFFNVLGLNIPAEPLNRFLTQIFQYIPKVAGAVLLLAVAWALANIVRTVVRKILSARGVDKYIGSVTDSHIADGAPVSKTVSEAGYWLVFLLFIPMILQALGFEGSILDPINRMFTGVLEYVPNILAALIILLAGWIVARIVSRITVNLVEASGASAAAGKLGIPVADGGKKISGAAGIIVYALIIIPAVMIALDALKIDVVTGPMKNMLSTILSAVPQICAALLILAVAYIVGKVLSGVTASILTNLGFDHILEKLGVSKDNFEGALHPSESAGKLVMAGVMFFAMAEAARKMGLDVLADLLGRFMVFAGQVILGVVIFAAGLWLANLAAKAITVKDSRSKWLALVVRIAVIIFAATISLRQMGIANEIIDIAFGLLFGSVAVAAAVAFGVGGKELASRKLEEWSKTLGKEEK